MPGPATLVAEVVRALEGGQCVVVGLPEYAPPLLRRALRRAAEHPAAPREWRSLSTQPLPHQPLAEWLWECWHPGTECPPQLTVARLMAEPFANEGSIWELPALPGVALAEWQKFLDDYERALRQVGQLRRNVLVLVVEEAATLCQLPRRDQPCLVYCRYQQQATRLDMLLYLSQLLPTATGEAALVRELRIQTAAALCPADPVLAACLAEAETCEPAALAAQATAWQQQRGWLPPAEPDQLAAWAKGQLGYADGQPEWHLCAPQAAALNARIRQARWLAQVRVLLPWLEQQRWRLLHHPELRRYYEKELPYRKEFGEVVIEITEVEQLEPTQMLILLRTNHAPQSNAPNLLRSQALHDQLALLRDCRNELSHLVPLAESRVGELLIQFTA